MHSSSQNPIFISYAREDRDAAETICAVLESRGYPTWIDHRDVPIGANYAATIAQAVRRAPALIVILSAVSATSVHVGQEVAAAGRRGIPVFVFCDDATAVPDEMDLYATSVCPHDGSPREERGARLLSEMVDRMQTATARSRKTEMGLPGAATFNHKVIGGDDIVAAARRSTWATVRACLIGSFVLLGTCIFADFVVLNEEFTPGEMLTETVDDVDLEDYAGFTMTFAAAVGLLLCVAVVACVSGAALAESLRMGQDIPPPPSLPSIRHPFRPMVRVREAVISRESVSSTAVSIWWPCLLTAAGLKLGMLAVVAASSTAPAIAVLGVNSGAHVLAILGTSLFFRIARALAHPGGLGSRDKHPGDVIPLS